MVRNWEMRRAAFGEKAFDSMTLDGALSEDMDTLKTGFLTCLRNGVNDKRAIILYDRPKLSHNNYDRDSAVSAIHCTPSVLLSCRILSLAHLTYTASRHVVYFPCRIRRCTHAEKWW